MPSRAEDESAGHEASEAARVWEVVSAHAAGRREQASIADVCTAATTLDVTGAWVTFSDGISPGHTMCATNVLSEYLAEIQVTLGEGPCHDAMTSGIPVLAADLADNTGHQWPAFSEVAVRAGAASVFAFPLRIGAIRVGVLGMYRGTDGQLDFFEFGSALILADIATLLLLEADIRQDDDPQFRAPPIGQSAELAVHDAEIAQATGMLTEQLGVNITEAFARLRAYAYAQDRRLSDIAHDIVTRRLRFDPDPPG